MRNRPFVWTGVFVVKDWKILVWERKSKLWGKTWSLPWWHLEFWETFEECWKREVKEESNLDVDNVVFLWLTNDIFSDKHYVTVFLLSDYSFWKAVNTEFDEFYQWWWFDIDSFPSPLFLPLENFLKENKWLLEEKIWKAR